MHAAVNALHPSAERVAASARRLGLEIRIREFAATTRTAADAAAAIGCSVAQIVKSLLFVVDDRPIMALVSGANRLSERKLADLCEVARGRIKRADADRVRRETGFAIGGVPPFGHPTPIATYIDRDFWRYDVVWAGAGVSNAVFAIAPDRLAAVTEGVRADLRQDPGAAERGAG